MVRVRFRVRFRARFMVMVRVRDNPYPNPNPNQLLRRAIPTNQRRESQTYPTKRNLQSVTVPG